MRVLRFLRNGRSSAALPAAAPPDESLGVDAFASEAPEPVPAPTVVRASALRSPLVWGLAVLVLIEAIPAGLWLRDRLEGARAATVESVPTPMPPPVFQASAPCEAVPSDAALASTAAKTPPVAVATAGAAAAGATMPLAGSIAVAAPVSMHVFEGTRLVGTTEAQTIMLAVGTHDLEFVSDAIGFRARRSVSVQPGRTTAVRLEMPRAALHVNALPWAEVWIDNQRIGETPLGNLQQPIGPHEIVFRHPELGERRAIVLVTLKQPARVSVDLRKP